jgi:hypothetical protein
MSEESFVALFWEEFDSAGDGADMDDNVRNQNKISSGSSS